MSSHLISGGPLISLRCSARFRHCLLLLVRVVDRCVSLLVRLTKADLLSDHFDSKQSREAVDLPLTCHLSPSLNTFAFRWREVRRLLLDLDPYGGTDPLGMFPLFLRELLILWPPVLVLCFSGVVVLVSRLAEDRPMSLQFRKVHRPPLLPITNRFP